MPAGKRDELKLVAHLAEFLAEGLHGLVVEVGLPVERRRAVVGQQLIRILGMDCLGELLRLLQIRLRGLTPDHVAYGAYESPRAIA